MGSNPTPAAGNLRGSAATLAPDLGEDLRSLVDAAYRLRKAISAGHCRRGWSQRGRHQRNGRVESQERDSQEASADRSLDEPSVGIAPRRIDCRRQCDRSRSHHPRGGVPLHESGSVRRRNDEIAALPAVSAAAPPAINTAFTTVPRCGPLRTAARASPTVSRSFSGSLFPILMTLLLPSPAGDRPS